MKINTSKILIFTLILFIGLTLVSATDINTTDTQNNQNIHETYTQNHEIISEQAKTPPTTKTLPKTNNTLKKESKTIILNNQTFDNYVTDRKFNDNVNPGDTIDIQGMLDDGSFTLNITKPVNIISSAHDAYINLDTRSRGYYPINPHNDYTFSISYGGSGTNISDITFHNTHIYTTNAHNITINNITATCNQAVGVGRGMISIREDSSNVTITNSYFETRNNGGHSNVVFAYAHNCLFENNTVMGHGFVGNLIYLTTYGSADDTGETNVTYGNTNITIRNNYIDGLNATDNGICVGIVSEGANHTIVNNTILKSRTYMIQINDYGTNTANITFEDNYAPYVSFSGLNITNRNYRNYGSIINDTYYLNENITNQNVLFNLNLAEKIYSEYEFKLISIESFNNTLKEITLNYSNIYINDLYAPDITFNLLQDSTVTNSSMKKLNLYNTKSNITNNIIINQDNETSDNPVCISINEGNSETRIENNYMIALNLNNASIGDNSIEITDDKGAIIKNNTPNNENVNILSRNTYDILFDENNTLKNNISGTIILIENITQPIIINKAINMTMQKIPSKDKTVYIIAGSQPVIPRKIPYYNNITFTKEAKESNITNAYIKNITINNTSINIKNNTITGNIKIINSNYNNITQNNITTDEEYTIIIDETSTDNIIKNNILIPQQNSIWIPYGNTNIRNTTIKSGDLSICNTQDNIISNNTPLNIVNISIETDDELFGLEEANVKINVTAFESPIKEGYVILLLNGKQVFIGNLTNGSVNTTIIPTRAGNNTIKAWYFTDKYYEANNATMEKYIQPINTTISIEAETVTVGETINITATIIDQKERLVSEGTVTFKVNDTEYNVTVTDGIANFAKKTNESWYGNEIYAVFNPTDLYNNSTSNTIQIEPGEVVLHVRQYVNDDKLLISVLVTDIGNTPVTNGYVRFKNGTKNLKVVKITSESEGIAEYEIDLTKVSNTPIITLNFTNNNAFNQKVENITLTTNPPITTAITMEEINGKTNEETIITATVTTTNNTPVIDGTITFTTTDYTEIVNVENGTATTTHTFTKPLQDILTATYTPTNPDDYYESTNTTTITITKNPEQVHINIDPITAEANSLVNITARIITEDNLPVSTGQITFTTTGYTETVNVNNGVATTTHIFTNTFEGNLTATFIPTDEDYLTSSNTTTITITEPIIEAILKIDTAEFTAGSTANITASIYLGDEIANNITGGKVVFKVNGKTLKDSNNKVIYAKVVNGQATIENYEIPSTWEEGTTITASYSGSTQCDKLTSETTEISITQEEASITIDPATASTGSTIQLTATVKVGQEPITVGKVVFKVNGKTVKDANGKVIYATINENGQVSVNYTIPENMKAKDYTITVTYTSALYGTLNNTAILTVN